MNAWKLEDKEWVKARKKSWKEFEFNIKTMGFWRSDDFPVIKDYFLTGNKEALSEIYEYITHPLLLELWLDGAPSIERYRVILRNFRELYTDIPEGTIQHFMNYTPVSNSAYRGVSYYNGLDLLLYQTLLPQRFLREFYATLSDEEFSQEAGKRYWDILYRLYWFFERESDVNQFDPVTLMIPTLFDVIKIAYHEREEFEWVIEYVDEVLASPDNFDELKVDLANEINQVLNDPELPDAAKEKIAEIRS